MNSATTNKPGWLDDKSLYTPPKIGDTVRGKIVNKVNSEIWIDFGGPALGIIPAREARDGLGTVKHLNIGDEVSAIVLSADNVQGYTILSLKKAAKDLVWEILDKRMKAEEVFEIFPTKANKGGLMATVFGIVGFLPVSQLSLANYPRVKENEKTQILNKLNRLVGKAMRVIVLDIDRDEKKLIFSERAVYSEDTESFLRSLNIGDIIEGTVSEIKSFGVFVTLSAGLEGMIHISEITYEKVEDPENHFAEGQVIQAKVVGLENDRVSLSTKALQEDPWASKTKGLEIGSKIVGKVAKYLPFGVVVKIKDDINAVCHISELSNGPIDKPSQIVDINKEYTFKIVEFDPEKQRIELSLKDAESDNNAAPAPKKEPKKEVVEEVVESTEEKPETVVKTPKADVVKTKSKKSTNDDSFTVDDLTIEDLVNAGVSKALALTIVENVKSKKALKKMTDEELLNLPGVGAKSLEKIRSVK